MVDSARIRECLEAELPTPSLIPTETDRAAAVRRQIEINDRIPHPGILYGFHANDPRPPFSSFRY